MWHSGNEIPQRDKRILFYIKNPSGNEQPCYTGHYDDVFFNDDAEGYITKGDYSADEILKWAYIEDIEKATRQN